jgi:hypothetical protein
VTRKKSKWTLPPADAGRVGIFRVERITSMWVYLQIGKQPGGTERLTLHIDEFRWLVEDVAPELLAQSDPEEE